MTSTLRAQLAVYVFLAALPVPAAVAGQTRPLAPSRTGPVIQEFGPVYQVPTDLPTPIDRDYRVVFDVASAPEADDVVNPRIETLARFLNMHGEVGVPPERMHLALVLHGNAGKSALHHAAYRERFGTDNANLALVAALKAAGVKVILCGQTASHRGFAKEDLAEPVELALSAMTALVMLQDDGYRLIAF